MTAEEYINKLNYELKKTEEQRKINEINSQLNGKTITGELPVSI